MIKEYVKVRDILKKEWQSIKAFENGNVECVEIQMQVKARKLTFQNITSLFIQQFCKEESNFDSSHFIRYIYAEKNEYIGNSLNDIYPKINKEDN